MRAISHAGKPRQRTPSVIATASLRPSSATTPLRAVAERPRRCRRRAWRRRCAPPAGPGGSRAARSAGTAGPAVRGRAPRRSRRSPTRWPCERQAGLHAHRAVHARSRPAAGQRQAQPARPPGSASPRPSTRPCAPAIGLAVGRAWRRASRDLAQRRAVRTSIPRPRSSRSANSERLCGHLLHDPLARLDQHPAHPLRRGSAGTARSPARRSPAARPAPRRRRSRRRRTRTPGTPRAGAGSSSDSAMSRQLSTWLRSAVASDSDFSPIACSASPGIGSVRETEPSATISWS